MIILGILLCSLLLDSRGSFVLFRRWTATFYYWPSKDIFAWVAVLHKAETLWFLRLKRVASFHQINGTSLFLDRILHCCHTSAVISHILPRTNTMEVRDRDSYTYISCCRELWWLEANLWLSLARFIVYFIVANKLLDKFQLVLIHVLIYFIVIVRWALFICASVVRIKLVWSGYGRTEEWITVLTA